MEAIESVQPSLKHLTDGSMSTLADQPHRPLQDLARPHIDSFNVAMQEDNLNNMILSISEEFSLNYEGAPRIGLNFLGMKVFKPGATYGKRNDAANIQTRRIYPKECRMSQLSYRGKIVVQVQYTINGMPAPSLDCNLGSIPIMVKSDLCHLKGLPPKKMVSFGEEAEDFGGYFIVNGIERIARLLIQQRRNMPLAIKRSTWSAKRKNYTSYGVSVRCVDEDRNISVNVAHYMKTGQVELSVRICPSMYYLPMMLVLIALTERPPAKIAELLSSGDDGYININTLNMMKILMTERKVISRDDALEYLGNLFKSKMQGRTNKEVAKWLIDNHICIHLKKHEDKFNLLVEMTRKLFRFANKECCVENPDWLSNQEVLTPGHLYQIILKGSLSSWLNRVRKHMEKTTPSAERIQESFEKAVKKSGEITSDMTRWISTGSLNLNSNNNLDFGLTQTDGLTVVADKLNFMRYFSHFRSVHRGSYFQDTKTTEVRKLRPETWGFLCPSHTPDGGPCGLLLHMAALSKVVTKTSFTRHVENVLSSLGVIGYHDTLAAPHFCYYLVQLDGKVIGWVLDSNAEKLVNILRGLKIHQERDFSPDMEICFIPKRDVAAQYPGIFIFTTPGRFVRPVINRQHDEIEWIGTLEQTYLHIAVTQKDIDENYPDCKYREISQMGILSELAAMTPFADHNHACRNMYQCQMAKQTMGTPLHAWNCRSDNKLYRIISPQAPLVRTSMYDIMKCDDYPIGTNAVVAVMSYTGFDMEDAIAINKGSYDRGFGYGSIIKTKIVNLKELSDDKSSSKVTLVFGLEVTPSTDPKVLKNIGPDGLPHVGTIIEKNDPLFSYLNLTTSKYTVVTYHDQDRAYVQQVVLGYNENDDPDKACQKATITLFVPRKPTIGDKFSSRHGQKGVCSILYPTEDMPFTMTGITPDIIFNPHGFPSRMTIGMMIELMAGKSGAELGMCHNANPFTYANGDEDEDDESLSAVEVFQDFLEKAGFNYNGTDIMLCGTNGQPLKTYIFTGVVYYQRLRHMVYDKWQVRMTGRMDNVTRQPIGGRKNHGGIRFGEMERDALIAHGASMLLHDRLFDCSDGTIMQACQKCGSIVSPIYGQPPQDSINQSPHWRCLTCHREDTIVNISVPYIFKYFVCQLASVNIKTELKIGQN